MDRREEEKLLRWFESESESDPFSEMENSMVTLITSPMIRQPIYLGTSLKVKGGMLRMIEILNRIRKKMKLRQKVWRAFGKRYNLKFIIFILMLLRMV
ncbi:hypothetical protein JTB14_031012 [Gonioctena quinquepunctata]|nr:hypothetical protein JTB14_031012 [Gonioctena quinquepunctata]